MKDGLNPPERDDRKRVRPTLAEVADRAEVSVSTVSRIANGNAHVGEEVEQRVRRAAAALGIRLKPKATTRVLAFLLANRAILHPFHARILSGAQTYCRSHNWDLLFLSSYYSADADPKDVSLPQIVLRRNIVQGLVLAGANYPSLIDAVRRRRVPYVVFGNSLIGEWTPEQHDTVFSDDVRGTFEATSHLISLGHRKICYIGDTSLPWYARSCRGYEQAMAKAGLAPRLFNNQGEEREIGYLAAKSLLVQGHRPTALVAGTDPVAEGIYRAARDLGLRIPEDLSVCGSNDTEASLLHPPLTTVRCFPEELGAQLVEMLLRRIAEPHAPAQQITIPTRLIKRESCVPPALYSVESVG